MSKYIKFNGAVYQKVAAAGDWAWLGSGERIFVPDVKITRDDPSYVYHPLRGYSASVAVENIDGRFIGWMSVDDLPGGPYKNTREWMVKNKVTGWEQARDYVPPSPRYEDTHYTRPKHYPTIGTVHKKVASVSLDEEASAYPRAANTVYVGLSWESKQGVKTVVDKTVRGDQERWLVQTEGRSFAELFSTDDIISEMKRDAANLQSQNKWKQEADELEKQKAVLEETYGFYATMSSMMKAKAKLALEKQQGFSGTVMRRKDAVEQRVKDGWQVQTDRSGKRIFTSPSGSFYYEKDITKWAMDYAQYLIDNQIL